MKVVCAWCKVVIKDGLSFPVSHGICPSCVLLMRIQENVSKGPVGVGRSIRNTHDA